MFKSRYYWMFSFGVFVIGILIFQFIHYSQTKIIIAVVDTGLDLKQIRFKLVTTQGFNVLNPDKPPQDDNGHGTQVSSVIHFLEPCIKIMSIKAIPKSGVATKQELAQGIIAAVNQGAKVINISAGVVSSSLDLENAVRYAEDRDVFIVAAVGDGGTGIEYPAAYPTVLAVGGIDHNGVILSNSNTGPELDVMVLGEYATIGLRGECLAGAGTSLAAPIVSVYIARILRDNPDFKPQEARNVILSLLIDTEKPGRDDLTGYGILEIKQELLTLCE